MNFLGKVGSADWFSSHLTSYKATPTSGRLSDLLQQTSMEKSLNGGADFLTMRAQSTILGLNYFGFYQPHRAFTKYFMPFCFGNNKPSPVISKFANDDFATNRREHVRTKFCDFLVKHCEVLGLIKQEEKTYTIQQKVMDTIGAADTTSAESKLNTADTSEHACRIVDASVLNNDSMTTPAKNCDAMKFQEPDTARASDKILNTSSKSNLFVKYPMAPKKMRSCKKKKMSKDKRLRKKKQQGVLPHSENSKSQKVMSQSLTVVVDVKQIQGCQSESPMQPRQSKSSTHCSDNDSHLFVSGASSQSGSDSFEDSDFEDGASVDLDAELWESLSQSALTQPATFQFSHVTIVQCRVQTTCSRQPAPVDAVSEAVREANRRWSLCYEKTPPAKNMKCVSGPLLLKTGYLHDGENRIKIVARLVHVLST